MTSMETILRYMRNNVQDHVDRRTDEVNATTLAEDACSHFNDYIVEEDNRIPDEYFDLAHVVAVEEEKRLRRP